MSLHQESSGVGKRHGPYIRQNHPNMRNPRHNWTASLFIALRFQERFFLTLLPLPLYWQHVFPVDPTPNFNYSGGVHRTIFSHHFFPTKRLCYLHILLFIIEVINFISFLVILLCNLPTHKLESWFVSRPAKISISHLADGPHSHSIEIFISFWAWHILVFGPSSEWFRTYIFVWIDVLICWTVYSMSHSTRWAAD